MQRCIPARMTASGPEADLALMAIGREACLLLSAAARAEQCRKPYRLGCRDRHLVTTLPPCDEPCGTRFGEFNGTPPVR
jgi:hypothetical protein